MRALAFGGTALALLLSACDGGKEEGSGTGGLPQCDTSHWHGADAMERVHFPQVPDQVKHDSLAVQITFDLQDGTHLMVAANVEETFEGLALYRFRAAPDSSAEVLARSSPAYDSWTMYPTFFREPGGPDRLLVFANFGEKQSWGQKVMALDSTGFTDIGFLEVALPVRVAEPDSIYLKRESIAPYLRLPDRTHGAVEFACDSVYIYNDGAGGLDRIVAANEVRFVPDSGTFTMYWKGAPVKAAQVGPAL